MLAYTTFHTTFCMGFTAGLTHVNSPYPHTFSFLLCSIIFMRLPSFYVHCRYAIVSRARYAVLTDAYGSMLSRRSWALAIAPRPRSGFYPLHVHVYKLKKIDFYILIKEICSGVKKYQQHVQNTCKHMLWVGRM
jgi:hypothetical protein